MKWIFAVVSFACATAAADPHLQLPELEPSTPAVISEDTPGPLYYRTEPDVVRGLARTAVGIEMRSSAERDGGSAFALDLFGGAAVRFGRGAPTGMWIEAGYSYNRFHEHLLVAGAGPARYRIDTGGDFDGSLSLALVPHVVAGSIDGAFGYGIRTSLIASLGLYGLELAHQYLIVGPQRINEIHLMFTAPTVWGS